MVFIVILVDIMIHCVVMYNKHQISGICGRNQNKKGYKFCLLYFVEYYLIAMNICTRQLNNHNTYQTTFIIIDYLYNNYWY